MFVLLPQGAAAIQVCRVCHAQQEHHAGGFSLNFNLNLNLPPACTTGFLPMAQQRWAAPGYPDLRRAFYCRVPQDSTLTAVRGAHNLPCETRPGKRAPTVKMWKATKPTFRSTTALTGRAIPTRRYRAGVPQYEPGEEPPPSASQNRHYRGSRSRVPPPGPPPALHVGLADSGGAVRPGHRYLHWARRADLHTIQPDARRR